MAPPPGRAAARMPPSAAGGRGWCAKCPHGGLRRRVVMSAVSAATRGRRRGRVAARSTTAARTGKGANARNRRRGDAARPLEDAGVVGAAIQERADPGGAANGLLLHEELWTDGATFSSAGAAPAQGARVSTAIERDELRLTIDEVLLGDAAVARWAVSVR